jgi:hypothetical protein
MIAKFYGRGMPPLHVCLRTARNRPVFLYEPFAEAAIQSLYRVQSVHPFILYGFVVLPTSISFVMSAEFPETDIAIVRRYQRLLAYQLGIESLWYAKPAFHWPSDPKATLEAMHESPVQLGLVASKEQYPWSSLSFQRQVSPYKTEISVPG